MEFKAMNAKLLMDPKRQIFLDENMLATIDELMQVRPPFSLCECLFHADDGQPGSWLRLWKVSPCSIG
jgi:hypothetical protein